VKVDETTHPFTTTCDNSKMLVQDVGATFGGGGLFTNNDSAKMNLDKWSGNSLWKKVGKGGSDCPECQARLRKSLTAKDGLVDPIISEEGRRFLAGLMCQLSDAQIADVFRVARVAEMPRYHNADGSFKPTFNEDAIIRQWADAFKKKREDLAAGRCQWKSQPADLKLVDNPAGLATVPNYCSAHPF
jgi:predicted nucleic acid-binding Zn ribbon protein